MLLCLNTAIKACDLRFVRNFPDSQKIKQKCKKKFKSIYPECGIMYHISRKTSVCGADICFHLMWQRQNVPAAADSVGCAEHSRILELK